MSRGSLPLTVIPGATMSDRLGPGWCNKPATLLYVDIWLAHILLYGVRFASN
jgi:hypothetical protein